MTEILREPVRDPAAWRGSDFAHDDSWIVPFEPRHMDEIDMALAAVARSGKSTYEFGREDFPLPTLGPLIADVVNEVENGRGFVLLRGLDLDRWTDEELHRVYWGFGVHLGRPISQNPRGEMISEVTDRGYDLYEQNNVRGYITRQKLKPHCDGSDIVTLLCVQPSKSGGQSVIASSLAVYNDILENHPEYLEPLTRGYYFDLRGEGPAGFEQTTRHRVPIYSYFAGRLSCRFSFKTPIDGCRKAGEPCSSLEQEAIEYIGERAQAPDLRFDMEFRRGDIQVLSNHSVLHAREEYEDFEEPERKRRLLRLWVNLPDGRPLDPIFADRYNNGPRMGVPVREGADYWAGAEDRTAKA